MRGLKDIRVPRMRIDQLQEVRLIRLRIEGLAAQLAASRIDRTSEVLLTRILEENETARTNGDRVAAVKLNRLFHAEIAKIAGMPTLQELIENMWLRMGPLIAAVYNAGGRAMISYHYEILEALRKRRSGGGGSRHTGRHQCDGGNPFELGAFAGRAVFRSIDRRASQRDAVAFGLSLLHANWVGGWGPTLIALLLEGIAVRRPARYSPPWRFAGQALATAPSSCRLDDVVARNVLSPEQCGNQDQEDRHVEESSGERSERIDEQKVDDHRKYRSRLETLERFTEDEQQPQHDESRDEHSLIDADMDQGVLDAPLQSEGIRLRSDVVRIRAPQKGRLR